MHTYTPANSVFDDSITNLIFNTVHYDRSTFTWSSEGGKSLNDFMFGIFIGHFLSDVMANKAVKGLRSDLLRT